MRKGFGELIAQRRIAAGLTPEQLAERLGYKTKTIVYRLESESQEPDAAVINGLVAALPISADELLRAMLAAVFMAGNRCKLLDGLLNLAGVSG